MVSRRRAWSRALLWSAIPSLGITYALGMLSVGHSLQTETFSERPRAAKVAVEERADFPTESLPRKGAEPQHARVEMVVCSDFGCPYSKRASGTVEELLADNGDLSFHHANLTIGVWRDSELKALASIAAQRQDRFWPMHDALFDARFESADDAIALARELGLDEGRFALDLLDPSAHAELQRQRHLCARAGVRAVPTFFINGRRVVGSVPRHEFQRVIDEERQRGG